MADECKCKHCGERFVPDPTKMNASRSGCGQQCPNCGIWTPIPFQLYRELGGKIPGEE